MTIASKRTDLAEALRPSATRELLNLMKDVNPSDLTACELVGLVAILGAAKERCNGSAGVFVRELVNQ